MFEETVFQILAIVLIISAMTISIYYRHKANQAGDKISTREEGRLLLNLRRVFGLTLWLTILAYLINPGWLEWSILPLPAWARFAGAAIMAACLPLVYWIFSSLGKNITPTIVTRQEHTLVTRGPYHWVRHPLYTVGFTLLFGFVPGRRLHSSRRNPGTSILDREPLFLGLSGRRQRDYLAVCRNQDQRISNVSGIVHRCRNDTK